MCWRSSISSFENRAPAPTHISRVSVFKLLVFFATDSVSTNIVGVPYKIVHLHMRNEVTSFMPCKAITHRYFSLIQHIHINVLAALRVMYTSVINCYMTLLTYTMQKIPSWEVNRFSTSQEFPRIIWNLKVHYHACKSQPPVTTLSQINATWHN